MKLPKHKINYYTNIVSFFVFIICGVTGILKFPMITDAFNIYENGVFMLLTYVHDISGLLLVVLIILHIFLHGRYMRKMLRPKTKKNLWIDKYWGLS